MSIEHTAISLCLSPVGGMARRNPTDYRDKERAIVPKTARSMTRRGVRHSAANFPDCLVRLKQVGASLLILLEYVRLLVHVSSPEACAGIAEEYCKARCRSGMSSTI